MSYMTFSSLEYIFNSMLISMFKIRIQVQKEITCSGKALIFVFQHPGQGHSAARESYLWTCYKWMTLKSPEYSVKGKQCTVITAAQPTYGSLLIWVSSSGSSVSKILHTFFSPAMFSCSSRMRHPLAQLSSFKVLDVWALNFVSNVKRNMAKEAQSKHYRKYRMTGNSDSARSWRQDTGTPTTVTTVIHPSVSGITLTCSQPEWRNPLSPVTKASDLEVPTLIQKPLKVRSAATREFVLRKSKQNWWQGQPWHSQTPTHRKTDLIVKLSLPRSQSTLLL